MSAEFKITDGDIGTVIRRKLVDTSGNAVDLSGLTTKVMRFKDSNGTAKNGAGTVTYPNGGSDGVVQYIIANGDIDKPGGWRLQFVLSNGTASLIRPPIEDFEVGEKL